MSLRERYVHLSTLLQYCIHCFAGSFGQGREANSGDRRRLRIPSGCCCVFISCSDCGKDLEHALLSTEVHVGDRKTYDTTIRLTNAGQMMGLQSSFDTNLAMATGIDIQSNIARRFVFIFATRMFEL